MHHGSGQGAIWVGSGGDVIGLYKAAPNLRPESYPYNLTSDIDGYTWYNAYLVACMPTMGRIRCYETLTTFRLRAPEEHLTYACTRIVLQNYRVA